MEATAGELSLNGRGEWRASEGVERMPGIRERIIHLLCQEKREQMMDKRMHG